MPIAIVVVGHSNWGKSQTLKALTDNVTQYRYWKISGKIFFIRRMSNDDLSEDLRDVIENLSPKDKEDVILTLCPDFDEPLKYTKKNIATLSKKYSVYFFVLQYQYGGSGVISQEEITHLKQYGRVELFNQKNVQASTRAKALREYIEKVVNA